MFRFSNNPYKSSYKDVCNYEFKLETPIWSWEQAVLGNNFSSTLLDLLLDLNENLKVVEDSLLCGTVLELASNTIIKTYKVTHIKTCTCTWWRSTTLGLKWSLATTVGLFSHMGSRFGALQFHTCALGFWRFRSFGISHNWSWIWSCRLRFGDFLTVDLELQLSFGGFHTVDLG
jgi:hypothetical protein